MFALLRTFSWQELRHHPWRNAAAVVAVMLGVALAFSVHLINASALDEFSTAVRSVNGQPDLELRAATGSFDEAVFAQVAQHPQVLLASPVVELGTMAVTDAASPRVALRVVGVDALVVAQIAPALMPRPHTGADRFALFTPGTVFLNPAAQAALGNTTTLQLQNGLRMQAVQVAGTVAARNSRSGWPFTERTAVENSSSADALIRCTENASATPSTTATTAAALRHGWWRSSCQEKVVRRASMQRRL